MKAGGRFEVLSWFERRNFGGVARIRVGEGML